MLCWAAATARWQQQAERPAVIAPVDCRSQQQTFLLLRATERVPNPASVPSRCSPQRQAARQARSFVQPIRERLSAPLSSPSQSAVLPTTSAFTAACLAAAAATMRPLIATPRCALMT